ncbi:hypothetical protein C8F01DRAFT_1262421 [Mycena amicta]|nr:hypothetical protein C8F01DRAFT_1262421 [Mycena amicta]
MPGLLRGRLPAVYHQHACTLVEIIKTCLLFTITSQQIDNLEEQIIEWVQEYERLYYRYKKDRLQACTLTIHGLLHIPQICAISVPFGSTGRSGWSATTAVSSNAVLQSRRFPWANMNRRVLHYIQMEQLQVRYNLAEEFKPFSTHSDALSSFEHTTLIIIKSYFAIHMKRCTSLRRNLRSKIARYYTNVIGQEFIQRHALKELLPQIMPRCAWAMPEEDEEVRDNTFVRFEMEVSRNVNGQSIWVPEICYGRLDEVLALKLPMDNRLRGYSNKIRLVAVITPVSTVGKDAAQEIVTYNRFNQQLVVDVDGITAGAGRFQTRANWVLVDQSGGLVRPKFVAQVEEQLDGSGVEVDSD